MQGSCKASIGALISSGHSIRLREGFCTVGRVLGVWGIWFRDYSDPASFSMCFDQPAGLRFSGCSGFRFAFAFYGFF